MLPLSSRLLARYKARFVPLQPQRRLKSTDIVRGDSTEFLQWTRTQIPKNQSKRSRSWPRNPRGGRPYKPKKIEGQQSSLGKLSNAKPCEKSVGKTVLAIHNDPAPAPGSGSWQGEDWKTDSWGQDGKPWNFGNKPQTPHGGMRVELKPPSSDRDLSPKFEESTSSELISEALGLVRSGRRTRESDIEFTRRLEGILTPLGSPVLQGASLWCLLLSYTLTALHRRETFDGTPSDRDIGP